MQPHKTVAVAGRVDYDTARSLRRIADISGTTISRVVGRLVVEQVDALTDGNAQFVATADR